jgi:hypothetical protein
MGVVVGVGVGVGVGVLVGGEEALVSDRDGVVEVGIRSSSTLVETEVADGAIIADA